MTIRFRKLALAGALALLGGCSQYAEMIGFSPSPDPDERDLASFTRLELVGSVVLSPTGTREAGLVSDALLGPDKRVQRVVIALTPLGSAPPRKVAVEVAELRDSTPREALVLVRMTAEQLAALPAYTR